MANSFKRGRLVLALLLPAVLIGGLAACTDSASASTSQAATNASQSTRLAALAKADVDAGAPGVIVRVNDGSGHLIQLSQQAAWTNADHRLKPSDEFRMGSNTKTMVATMVLQMVAERKIGLNAPIEKYLPGLVPNGRNITIRMLLNHTSGLFNYLYDPAVLKSFTGEDHKNWTPEELLAAGVRHAPNFAPGSAYSYSNTNYDALGLTLEKVSGQSLAALVQSKIAEPLGLKHTYLSTGSSRPNRVDRPLLAHGYEPDATMLAPLLPEGIPAGTAFVGPRRGTFVDATWINSSSQWAAGAMISTATDWAHFDSALMSGKLIPKAELAEMRVTVPEDPNAPDGNGYGLGLRKVVFPCGTVWGHDGQAAGYSSETFTDSSGKRTVAVLTSTIFGLAVPKAGAADSALVNAAVCAMLGKPVSADATK